MVPAVASLAISTASGRTLARGDSSLVRLEENPVALCS